MHGIKKWVILLVVMLSAAVLVACGGEEPTPTSEPQPVATEAPAAPWDHATVFAAVLAVAKAHGIEVEF